MPFFEITLFVEPETEGGAEIEITRLVEARDVDGALDLAKKLRDEIPEIDPLRVTTWHIEKRTVEGLSVPNSNLA